LLLKLTIYLLYPFFIFIYRVFIVFKDISLYNIIRFLSCEGKKVMIRSNMRNLFYRFFQGRYGAYGTDRLSKTLLVIAAVLLLLSYVTPLGFLYYLAFALVIYCYFRLFSRNIPKRYRENEYFVKHTDGFFNFFKNFSYNISQMKMYHIYKCPDCKQKIRIPRGKGKIAVRCPKCGKEFIKHS